MAENDAERLPDVADLIKAQRAMEEMVAAMHGDALLSAFRDSVLMVERDAKIIAPVDTGRLRASITPTVTVDGEDVTGIVGSNVVYAPFVEFGTRPHYPPIEPLLRWVHLHHLEPETEVAYRIQHAIGRRGTKSQPYLRPAIEANKAQIIARIEQAIQAIGKIPGEYLEEI